MAYWIPFIPLVWWLLNYNAMMCVCACMHLCVRLCVCASKRVRVDASLYACVPVCVHGGGSEALAGPASE